MPLRLFRLVSSQWDPVTLGERLTRSSDHSHQKLGDGMYFALSKSDAIAFAATPAGKKYGYTHLVEAELPFIMSDFFDLRRDQNAMSRWWSAQLGSIDPAKHNSTGVAERARLFCGERNAKGLIWSPSGALQWDELVILTAHIGAGFEVTSAERLA